ncbi:MAG TPA: DNA (cytosine-5-)-methyltransferase [Ktedonobacteraceae bacterium]|nr:DNA (cytosine-5-)-methyltransferase [Ktedonobacteraceae bacterium]
MVSNHIARSVGKVVQQRINHLGVGQKMQDLPEELWHESFRFYVKEDPTRQGGPNLRMIRLDPTKPSLTVTGYIFNKFVHPFEDRFITVREAARLQGFPDTLTFEGTLTSTQQQVGNAVPVPLAKAVFTSILQDAINLGYDNGSFTAFSLFSGAGGLDIGAEQAAQENLQIHTKIALDNWSDACNTLKGYFKSKAGVIHADIVTIGNPLQCWRTLSGETKPPDLVYGGPPCQSFSQAGKQKGVTDERGQLIFEFLRFVSSLQPAFFVMENVSNLKGVERGTLYTQIIDQIEKLNYNVTVETLLAADFGAPQLRRRLLFLGCRNDIGHLSLPTPTHSENPTLFDPPYTTVGEAFQGLPEAQYTANLQKRIKRRFTKEPTKKIFLPV